MAGAIHLPFRFYVAVFISLSIIFYQLSGKVRSNVAEEKSFGIGISYTVEAESTTSAPTTDEYEREIANRKKTMDEFCAADRTKLPHSDVRGHILINTKFNLGLCYVPKTGCTFWKRIIYKLEQIENNQNVKELFDIGKNKIHTMPIRKLYHFDKFQDGFDFWRKAQTIVFARDPYSRLFSAYIDKFYLPDFWASGDDMLMKFRKNITAESMRCGHDLTFEEFLRYVTEAEATNKYMNSEFVDDHWQPVSRICQPCQMNYDVVAKVETFSADRDFIMRKLGISSMLPQSKAISRDDTSKDAMNQTIDGYWRTVLKEKPCVSQLQLVQRFWRSFQIQGYIPSALELPTELLMDGEDIKEPFRKIAMSLYDNYKLSPEEWKQQRSEEMARAYSRIPTEIMMDIQKHFRLDFELFSYESQPHELYHFR